MLVNMMGIEEETTADATEEPPVAATPDPKSRDTLTTLFGALLSSFVAPSNAPAPTRAVAKMIAIFATGSRGAANGADSVNQSAA